MNFEIGDKVIIPSKPDTIINDEPCWLSKMNDYIGKEGTIIDILPKNKCICVKFENGDYWWYSFRWFEALNNNLKVNNSELNNLELLLI